MKRPQKIPITDVKTKVRRELREGDETFFDLAGHIASHGLKRPIVVDREMNLIDGLRRMEAVYGLGADVINAYVVDTLEEACEGMNYARLHGYGMIEADPRRIFEVYTSLVDLVDERAKRSRRRRIGLKRGEKVEPAIHSRALVSEALGYKGESFLTAALTVYRTLEGNEDPSKAEAFAEIIDDLEAHRMTVYEARSAIIRINNRVMGGDISTTPEWRSAMTTALAQLSGATKVLALLGSSGPEITSVELQMYMKSLEEQRRLLHRFINTMRRSMNQP